MSEYRDPRQKSCRKCRQPVFVLPYDGTGGYMAFDRPTTATRDDVEARRYVMYSHPKTGQDRARLVTKDEPWDEDLEHPLKQHLLSCPKDPRNPNRHRTPAAASV